MQNYHNLHDGSMFDALLRCAGGRKATAKKVSKIKKHCAGRAPAYFG